MWCVRKARSRWKRKRIGAEQKARKRATFEGDDSEDDDDVLETGIMKVCGLLTRSIICKVWQADSVSFSLTSPSSAKTFLIVSALAWSSTMSTRLISSSSWAHR